MRKPILRIEFLPAEWVVKKHYDGFLASKPTGEVWACGYGATPEAAIQRAEECRRQELSFKLLDAASTFRMVASQTTDPEFFNTAADTLNQNFRREW